VTVKCRDKVTVDKSLYAQDLSTGCIRECDKVAVTKHLKFQAGGESGRSVGLDKQEALFDGPEGKGRLEIIS
jgi:hypothetical protein